MNGSADVSGETGTRTSRGLFIRALGLLGLVAAASWALAGNPLAAWAAVERVQQVFVTNDSTAPVPTESVGGTVGIDSLQNAVQVANTPNVRVDTSQGAVRVDPQGTTAVSGTVGIDPANNTVQVTGLPAAGLPFQQIVTGDTEFPAGTICTAIASPATGKLLRINNIVIKATANGATNGPALIAYLRPFNQTAAEFVDIPIPLQGEQALRHGELYDIELLHGSVGNPATKQFNYHVCVQHINRLADSVERFSAVVTGELISAN